MTPKEDKLPDVIWITRVARGSNSGFWDLDGRNGTQYIRAPIPASTDTRGDAERLEWFPPKGKWHGHIKFAGLSVPQISPDGAEKLVTAINEALTRPVEPQRREGAANFIQVVGEPMCVHGDCSNPITKRNSIGQGFCYEHFQETQYTQEDQKRDKSPTPKLEALRAARDAIQDFCNSGDEVSWEEAVNVLALHHKTIRQLLDAAIERGE